MKAFLFFLRSFLISVVAIGAVCAVIFGCAHADQNTRKISRGDDSPAICFDKRDGGYDLHFFGWELEF